MNLDHPSQNQTPEEAFTRLLQLMEQQGASGGLPWSSLPPTADQQEVPLPCYTTRLSNTTSASHATGY